jgi:hypothetical protein
MEGEIMRDKKKPAPAAAGHAPSSKKRKPYQSPKLAEYGDLRRIVMAKASNRFEATGKPATKR